MNDQFMYPNNNYYYNGGYGAPFYAQPLQQQQLFQPGYQNALTDEEISKLKNMRPAGLNLSVEYDDVLRSMCTHKYQGRDMVQRVENSDEVYCPICGKKWVPAIVTKEELQELVNKIIARMQDSKWSGELPTEVVREYYTMIPLLEKFPDVFEYGNKNFNRLINQTGYFNANDMNLYSGYNSLFGGNIGYGGYPYQQPMYYNQPTVQQVPQPNNLNNQQQQFPPQGQGVPMAQPGYNPMGMPMQPQPTQQFTNQAQMMMPGYPSYPYQQPQMPVQGQPMQQPANPYANNNLPPVQNATPQQPAQAQAQQKPATESKRLTIDL